MKAVVLAGGQGRRLRPFSVVFPKPLAPIGDWPVIEHLVRYLVGFGVREVVLCVDYLAEMLRAYLDSRSELLRQVTIRYVRDEKPGGTAGPLAAVEGLDDTFLVTNGDLVTDLDLSAMLAYHRQKGAVLTIGAYARKTQLPYGLIRSDGDGFVHGYEEKPTLTNEVSMGIYYAEPAVLRHIPRGQFLNFPDLVLKLLAAGERVCRFRWDGYWMDIGNPDDYAQAQDDCAAGVGPWAARGVNGARP